MKKFFINFLTPNGEKVVGFVEVNPKKKEIFQKLIEALGGEVFYFKPLGNHSIYKKVNFHPFIEKVFSLIEKGKVVAGVYQVKRYFIEWVRYRRYEPALTRKGVRDEYTAPLNEKQFREMRRRIDYQLKYLGDIEIPVEEYISS